MGSLCRVLNGKELGGEGDMQGEARLGRGQREQGTEGVWPV